MYLDGSVVSVRLSEGFSESICNDQPLFDLTVRPFLVPNDLKVLADMKCALLATHTPESTSTAGFYCPARVHRSYLLEIGNPSKEWVLYHNLKRVGLEVIQVEHGDYFVLFEKVPKKTRFPPSFDKVTSGPASESIGNADQEQPAWPLLDEYSGVPRLAPSVTNHYLFLWRSRCLF